MKMPAPLPVLAAAGFLALAALPVRADFSPGPNPITGSVTTQQTLSSGSGVITSTGSVSLSSADGADVILMGGTNTQLQNGGEITRSGGSGGSTGVIIEATADTISIINDGLIANTGDGRAIRNQSVTAGGVSITNNGTIQTSNEAAIEFVNSELSLFNYGTIQSTNGRALDLLDMTSAAGYIANYGTIEATGADGIGAGAGAVILNEGTIRGIPVSGSGSDGIQTDENSSVEITNTGLIQGRHGITGGISDTATTPYTITVHNEAGGQIIADNGSGVNIDGLTTLSTATVTNAAGATIQGNVDATSADGDGDGVDVDGVVNLTNYGDVLGYGAKGVDSGGQPNNAEAVAAGGGTIINYEGGRIIGSTLASDAPNGNPTREGRAILIDDGSGGSGVAATEVTNSGEITGRTGYAIKFVGDFNDTITNGATGTITGNSADAAVQMGAGNDQLNNSGAITNNVGTVAVAMEDGDDTVTLTGGTVTGDIDGGNGNDAVNVEPGTGGAASVVTGSLSNVEALNVSGDAVLQGTSTLAGAATVSSGGRLVNEGSLGATTILVTAGGALGGTGTFTSAVVVQSTGAVNPGAVGLNASGQLVPADPGTLEFAAGLALESGSILNLALRSLAEYDAIAITGGIFDVESALVNLTNDGLTETGEFVIIDYTGATLNGDLDNLTLNTVPSGWTVNLVNDGANNRVLAQVTAVPEPAAGALLLAAAAGLALRRHRA